MSQVVILGASGFAKQVAWCAQRTGHRVLAMIDELISEPGEWQGIPILSGLGEIGAAEAEFELVSAVGNAALRRHWAEKYASRARFATMVDESALRAPSVDIGEGSVVLHGSICSVNVSIGSHTLIGFNVSLSHDVHVGSFTHLAGGVIANGRARIGNECTIGAGAIILPDIEIGDGATVGAACLVTRNVKPGTKVVGIPGREFSPRQN